MNSHGGEVSLSGGVQRTAIRVVRASRRLFGPPTPPARHNHQCIMMWQHRDVRTTLDLDEDILAAARELARGERQSLGAIVSALARAGLRPRSVEVVDGLPVIRATKVSPVITSETVRRALEDE